MIHTHPSDAQLHDFLIGKLPDPEYSVVESHLANCEECVARAAASRQTRDSLVALLADNTPGVDPDNPPSTIDVTPATGYTSPLRAANSGRFTVLKPHAKGGLGQLSIARDEKLRRHVALKEIRSELAGDPYLRQRFVNEAEITGQLEHPGIVPIYALDEHADGRPYYAMRFIQGRTLGEAIRAYHAQPAPLTFRELLKHFVTVCQTMAYAHSKGVIHRDLKPANVMLGDYGETLVVDWGLAKQGSSHADVGDPVAEREVQPRNPHAEGQGDHPELTIDGQVLGTPSYMSPEQAAGHSDQIGPATDIYALGAVLYEVIFSRPPYANVPPQELLRKLQAREPPAAPGQLRQSVPRALEAIARKAMSLDPSDRYASAAELADEVDRYLGDEPVQCFRESLPARAARWARRHPIVVAVVGAVLLTTSLALGVGFRAVNAERVRTASALTRETRAKDRTRAAIYTMTDSVIGELLAKQAALSDNERRFLSKVLGFFEDLAEEQGESPLARVELAEGLLRIGHLRKKLGELAEADEALQQAAELLATAPLEYRSRLAEVFLSRGSFLKDTGRLAEAEAVYREALEIHRTGIEAGNGDLSRHREGWAATWSNLGNLLEQQGRHDEATAAFQEALTTYRQLVRAEDTPKSRENMAQTLLNLAAALVTDRQFEQAEEAARESIELLLRATEDNPASATTRFGLAGIRGTLGMVLAQTRRGPEALSILREAVADWAWLADKNPVNPEYRNGLAKAHNNLGILQVMLGQPASAEESFRNSIAVRQQVADYFPNVPQYQSDLGASLTNLAFLIKSKTPPEETLLLITRAQPYHERALKSSPRNPEFQQGQFVNYCLFAELHLDLGQHAVGADYVEKLLQATRDPLAQSGYSAGLLARCSTLALSDNALPEESRAETSRKYAERAVQILREAEDKGFRNLEFLRSDKSLDPLRTRPDFQQLLEAAASK